MPIQHRMEYKVAVLTVKSDNSATAPTYLSHHIKARASERSSAVPLLDKPFTRTDLVRGAFRCSAPIVWNSLPETIVLTHFLSLNLGLRCTSCVRLLSNTHNWPAASASEATALGTLQIGLLLLYYLITQLSMITQNSKDSIIVNCQQVQWPALINHCSNSSVLYCVSEQSKPLDVLL